MMKHFLPGMRGLLAHEMSGKRMSQGKIAELLGVTQAAVSQYLSKERASFRRKVAGLGIEPSRVDHYVALIGEDLFRSPVEGVFTLYSIWRSLLVGGVFCEIHRHDQPLLGGCDACMRLFAETRLDEAKGEVISKIEQAVRLLESSVHFPRIMPQVSVNIVMCTGDAKDEGDVAGIPGRMARVRGRAKALMKSEFGSSGHMARVLLLARRWGGEVKAVLNIGSNEQMIKTLRSLGLDVQVTMPKAGLWDPRGDIVVAAISATLEGLKRTPDILVDEGGMGLEPIAYIFGEDAIEVAETALLVSRRYADLVDGRSST